MIPAIQRRWLKQFTSCSMFRHGRTLRLASLSSCKHERTRIHTLSHSSTTCPHSLSDLLPLCSSTQSLQQTKQAHAIAIVNGILPRSISVSVSLILRYAAFGDPPAFRTIFDQAVPYSRSAFLWNTLIRAHNIAGVHDRFETYNSMVRTGVNPDDYTFPFVFKSCADHSEVRKGMEAHGFVFKLGFDRDLYVGNTLLQFYGGCCDLGNAQKVFDEMTERDSVSWNTMIGVFSINECYEEAIDAYQAMKTSSMLKPNSVTIVTVLPVCAELEDEVMVSELHCYVLKTCLDEQITIRNALIDSYGKCGNSKASKQVFDEIVEKNEVSWNALITSLAYKGDTIVAFNMFRAMVNANVKPNSITISSIIPVLIELDCFKFGKEVHSFSVRTNAESDIFVANSLIDMYAKSGFSDRAKRVFYKMGVKNLVSWNAMISNFAQNGCELASLGLLREMQNQGEISNFVTFVNVLPACARLGLALHGKEIHAKSIRKGYSFDLIVSNALTDMYVKCGCLNLAQNMFNHSFTDEISYNILISGYSQTSDCSKSLVLFKEMSQIGMKHDIVSYMGVLSACSNGSLIKQGKEIHGFLTKRLLDTHLFVSNSILDLYTKCGRIDISAKIFKKIPRKDAASWNTMILGFAMLGRFETAIELFESMKEDGVGYDSISYIAVLSACSHGGLVNEGRRYFNDMFGEGIKPTQKHYACMIDILGRAGLFEEVIGLIESLPVEPDSNIWGSLLGACRIHGNMELGCLAAEKLFRLEQGHSGYFTLVSNMYAEAGRWDEADRVRGMMKLRGVHKNPGCSWVDVGDGVHAFVCGEKFEAMEGSCS